MRVQLRGVPIVGRRRLTWKRQHSILDRIPTDAINRRQVVLVIHLARGPPQSIWRT